MTASWPRPYNNRCVGTSCSRKCYPPQCNEAIKDICIDYPYYDMCTFSGRFSHFMATTFPTGAFRSKYSIDKSSDFIFNFKHNRLRDCLTEEELWHHRYVTYANVHPDTREAYHPLTRLPHQALVNTVIAGGMIAFCKSYTGLAFWQWAYQTYQAYINWNHRQVPSCISDTQIRNSYILGTVGSISTALSLKYVADKYIKGKPPFYVSRLIPLAALLVGNLVAIPAWRAQELRYGIPIYDQRDHRLGKSIYAAQQDVTQRMIVRDATIALPLLLAPFLIHPFRRDTNYWICRYPHLRKLLLLSLLGGMLAFSTPFALSLFSCPGEMSFCDLDHCVRQRLEERLGDDVPYTVFYRSEC